MKAEYYDHVTIFCSDIMGFTTITSKSTPIQVRREREREKERERGRGREKIHDTKKWLLYIRLLFPSFQYVYPFVCFPPTVNY